MGRGSSSWVNIKPLVSRLGRAGAKTHKVEELSGSLRALLLQCSCLLLAYACCLKHLLPMIAHTAERPVCMASLSF